MKLKLNKLMAGLVMAGSVVALVGCGDGGSPTLGASSNVTTAIKAGDTKAIATAQTITKAFGEAGANFTVPTAIVFDSNVTPPGARVPTIPANSVLNINPTTVAGAIGDFKITAPGSTKSVEGVVLPGSCNFQVTGPLDVTQLLDGYSVGETYRIGTCAFIIPTTNSQVGTQSNLTPSLVLGTTSIPAGRSITITVNDNGSVTALLPVGTVVNGVPITTPTPVTVAPAGSVSLTTGT